MRDRWMDEYKREEEEEGIHDINVVKGGITQRSNAQNA